jgi:hypothetical protein
MNAARFDTIAKLFAVRRSRRQALVQAGAGIAATLAAAGAARPAVAQDTPPADGDGPMMLFIQSFQAGSVIPKAEVAGRYTLTLEQGLGHTVYFSDRPDRIVGSMPTPQFLSELGFSERNPPNAALVVETDEGQTELVVLQLYSPAYDEPTRTATYDVAVLAQWGRRGEQFAETDTDLAQILPTFGAAHLFIDDYDLNGDPVDFCPRSTMVTCWSNGRKVGELDWFGVCEARNGVCQGTFLGQQSFQSKQSSFNVQCNATFSAACGGNCVAQNTCAYDL